MSEASLNEKLGLVRFVIDAEPHIRINRDVCARCRDRACTRVCPAECFTLDGERLTFSHQNCLECGACRISCQNGALDWSYPKGGYGVCFRF
jgi:ferredoxin like protein